MCVCVCVCVCVPTQDKLLNSRTFVVGCGALGCELLKDFALLGVGCGPSGLITCTDNDRIEVSNLNRQFLFREKNVGQAKSLAAAHAVKAMNPHVKVCARVVCVRVRVCVNVAGRVWLCVWPG